MGKKYDKEDGRSMIEMLGVLAIIGVLSVGGIAGYSKAMHRYRLNKTIEQITQIAGNVRSFFAPQKSYRGLFGCGNNNAACKLYKKAKLLPDDMWDETARKYIGVYGYEVHTYAKDKTKLGDNLAFYIGYHIGQTEESIAACIDLITHDWSSAGVKVIDVGGPAGSAYFKLPVSINIAVEKCENIVRRHQNASQYGAEYPYIYFYFDIDFDYDEWKSKTYVN